MFLSIILVCQFVALSLANPFHKYPFVFLLDVGNEELQNTRTEQIRLSAPGGSIAIRYPATQGGDTIVHVCVSGIDFGTDLKANTVEGGPGYNYVVISFEGNLEVAYDAVVTIQTLSSDSFIQDNIVNNMSDNAYDAGEILSPKINSAAYAVNNNPDDINMYRDDNQNTEEQSVNSDRTDSDNNKETNQIYEDELALQPSANIYNYTQNTVDSEETGEDAEENIKDKDVQGNIQVPNYDNVFENENNAQELQDGPKAERYVSNGYVSDESYDGEQPLIVDNNLYSKYEALKSHFNGDEKLLPQQAVDDGQGNNDYDDDEGDDDKTDLREDDPVELDQMFNDEEVHNDAVKFRDSNNNYFDSEDSSAVAS